MKMLRTSFILFTSLMIITGFIYPMAITAFSQLAFPAKADGSLEIQGNIVVGSSLIGQNNNKSEYFWPRPSAVNYSEGNSEGMPLSSGATNYSMTSASLQTEVNRREIEFRRLHGLSEDMSVPGDMLYASGSGLDPHISPEAAFLQADRVAQARGLPVEDVTNLIRAYIEQPQLGFLGQARVNVLLLNLALDQLE